VFLIGVGVDESLKGNGLVNYMISHLLRAAYEGGMEYAIGYGRLPELHKLGTATISEAKDHLLQRKEQEPHLPADYGARFHVRNGAVAIAVIPEAMDDPESLNYGFLAAYDLQKIFRGLK